jgi:hypothetical protein
MRHRPLRASRGVPATGRAGHDVAMVTGSGVRTVATKMGLRAGMRAFLIDAPGEAVEGMGLPPLEVADDLTGLFDHLHLFTTTQRELDERFAVLREHLAASGMLWVSGPKGRKSVDPIWSGLKFTHPEPGKVYRNSYGTLSDSG